MDNVITKDAELAWPEGDSPSSDFIQIPASVDVYELVESEIIPRLGCSKWYVVSITPQMGLTGRFRLDADEQKFFLRISSRTGYPELEKRICDYLFENSASVNHLITIQILVWKGRKLRIDLRPFIDGGHFQDEYRQLESLGREISIIHDKLKSFPLSSEVRNISSKRFRHYADVAGMVFSDMDKICSLLGPYSEWAEKNMEWLYEMSKNFSPSFYLLENAQCLHGEIHPGNVIFEKNSGRAVLLDFEESVHVFAPVSWDLAFAVQRFILRNNPSIPEMKKRISAFETGYGKKLPPLSEMMRQAAWFTMAVIIDLFVNHSIITSISELDKFVRLERQAFVLGNLI